MNRGTRLAISHWRRSVRTMMYSSNLLVGTQRCDPPNQPSLPYIKLVSLEERVRNKPICQLQVRCSQLASEGYVWLSCWQHRGFRNLIPFCDQLLVFSTSISCFLQVPDNRKSTDKGWRCTIKWMSIMFFELNNPPAQMANIIRGLTYCWWIKKDLIWR
jgi:hypothetical protein